MPDRKEHWGIIDVAYHGCLIYPEKISDIVGLVLFAGLFALQYIYKGD